VRVSRSIDDRSVEACESDDFRMFIDTWMKGLKVREKLSISGRR
jgi:hypothetical protein